MCGIVGYFGREISGKDALDMLKNLEYRGYDSWGISIKQKSGFYTYKKVGKISEAKIPEMPKARIAILHSRWATHGNVTELNAHPHFSNDGKIAVVHNGIIENYQELKRKLEKDGFKFKTQTDTEVIPNLIQKNLGNKKASKQDLLLALIKTFKELEGHYALLILHKDVDAIFAARQGSPLIAGIDSSANVFFASDVSAFLRHTNNSIFFNDAELAVADSFGLTFSDFNLKPVKKQPSKVALDISNLDKQGYPYYMIKEIMEQRETIKQAIMQSDEKIMELAKVINESFGSYLIGCGTAGRVALAGTYLFSKITHKHVNFTVASEFPNYIDFIKNKSLVIAISQSGET
ncbi:MAG: SIS domain-containing protein, partial [archaeon]